MPIALIAVASKVQSHPGSSRSVLIGRPARIPYFATADFVLVQ
jgi:hypothetical protein